MENNKTIDVSKPLVELKDIYKTYKNKNALNGVNLVINPGDRIGVIGANGSGKSTMSEIIGGIRKPTSGEVVRQENLTIGLQFQESKYPLGITVIDMIKYYLETFSIPMKESELNTLLDTYQINGFKNKFISSLSGGQQQRLNILLSLIHNPDLVILDEVSTGLDIEVRTEIFNFIKENVIDKNKALFLVTHMMSEIEELCEKYIYVNDGEIQDAGLVKDLIKTHGSVHAYTWKKFKEDKHNKPKEEKVVKKQKENKFDRIINSEREKGKNIPLVKLLFKYYLKGGAVPFFVFMFPILLLFLEGFAFKGGMGNPEMGESLVHSIIGSLSAMQIIAVGVFIIPQTILEFKNSVLMKRIGATNIKPTFFVITVNLSGIAIMLIGYFWTLLWAGIMFGGSFGWDVAWAYNTLESLPFLLLILVSSISLGMMLSSIFKSTTTYIAVSNVIYMPIAFLSGSFMPIELIEGSTVLKYATYINLFKYSLEPFLAGWNGKFEFTYVEGIYLGVALALIAVYSVISAKKMRWGN
ncbi:ABC transporter ATP-binding protein/permease [Spiroplasma culicicola]|uniref:ABC transporter ATP-binding protein n=1 Tax=Spiroplasma culicicola AES-1 TaxID=1276246 RepID=W6A8N1_9MOLU|nr:ABC transporter ATP-binding protein/permease [Spiroplasma culicicola]AHI53326.1 ABC transporter ATP-binding protein [Spiroplasma culicicola AES-1]